MDLQTTGGLLAAAGAIYREVKPFITAISPLLAEELKHMLGEQGRAWRTWNALRLFQRTKEKCEAAGLDPKPLAPGILHSLLQQATLEDDETLQDKWAGLMASIATSGTTPKYFVTILDQLEAAEALLLERAFLQQPPHHRGAYAGYQRTQITYLQLKHLFAEVVTTARSPALEGASLEARLGNLERLQLLEQAHDLVTIDYGQVLGADRPEQDRIYYITSLGTEFVLACRGPKKAGAVSGE